MTQEQEEPDAFDAAYWEDRYRGGQGAGVHAPSPSLVAEAAGLVAGTALDAGCGPGADALWLAGRGWDVTAVDVSATALAAGRDAARAAGPGAAARVAWVQADLATWEPGERRFDLVTCSYVHLPGPAQALFARLASWVAPGGTLLVAGHDAPTGHGGHAHPPHASLDARQVTQALPDDGWEVAVAESRTHTRPRGDALATTRDVVVRARRASRSA